MSELNKDPGLEKTPQEKNSLLLENQIQTGSEILFYSRNLLLNSHVPSGIVCLHEADLTPPKMKIGKLDSESIFELNRSLPNNSS